MLEAGIPMKTFTLDEAQALLPLLESLLKRAIDSKRAAQEVEVRLAELGRRIYLVGGMRVNVGEAGRMRTEMEGHLQRVRESVAEIDAIGVQLKDIETGLLDFPCRIDDQVVLLCWRLGEASIEHWHTVEDGFKGRRPLDDRFRRHSNTNRPNRLARQYILSAACTSPSSKSALSSPTNCSFPLYARRWSTTRQVA